MERDMTESRLLRGVRDTVSEFSENTSIHGVRYIAEHDRNWVERLLWVVTEVVSAVCAVYLMVSLLNKFQDNPTMTRVDPEMRENVEVPFPAITLCNTNRIFKSKARKLVDRLVMPSGYVLFSEDVYDLLPLLGHLLARAEVPSNTKGRARLHRILAHNNLTAPQAMRELGQSCDELLARCSWEGREVSCGSVFQRTMSHLGYCCTFNSRLPMDLYETSQEAPLRSASFGYPLGLTALLNVHTDDYFWGPYMSGGILCVVHDSDSMATEQSASALVTSGQEVMVQVNPSIRNASSALRTLSAARRRCLFPDDSQKPQILAGSRAPYNYDACVIECKHRQLLRACGCLPMQSTTSPSSRRCDLTDLPCVTRFEEAENSHRAEERFKRPYPRDPDKAEENSESLYGACGCLSPCVTVDYDIETTYGDFKAGRWIHRPFYDYNTSGLTLLHVYYGKQTVTGFVNDLISDPIQLVSSLGGVFSLFFGCSFMSLVELVYFFTVRLWVALRKSRVPGLSRAEARAARAARAAGVARAARAGSDSPSPRDPDPDLFSSSLRHKMRF